MGIVEKAKNFCMDKVKEFGSDPYRLKTHLPEVEKWAKFITKKLPEIDKEIIFLAVWLHDSGHYPVPTEIDHAVRSEKLAKDFLEKEMYDSEKAKKVLHCVLSHRCKDVMPETKEAKLFAFIDSASHMTDAVYAEIARDHGRDVALAKLERDYRDLHYFPEIKKELLPLYSAWKRLLEEFERVNMFLS